MLAVAAGEREAGGGVFPGAKAGREPRAAVGRVSLLDSCLVSTADGRAVVTSLHAQAAQIHPGPVSPVQCSPVRSGSELCSQGEGCDAAHRRRNISPVPRLETVSSSCLEENLTF